MTIKDLEERMPPLDAALALENIGMQEARREKGMAWCAEFGVGGRRKRLGHAVVHFAPPLDEVSTQSTRLERLRDQCQVFLAQICEKCPHAECPMKHW